MYVDFKLRSGDHPQSMTFHSRVPAINRRTAHGGNVVDMAHERGATTMEIVCDF